MVMREVQGEAGYSFHDESGAFFLGESASSLNS